MSRTSLGRRLRKSTAGELPMQRFTRLHVGVVSALLVLGLLCAGWVLLRARPVAVASPGDVVTVAQSGGHGQHVPRQRRRRSPRRRKGAERSSSTCSAPSGTRAGPAARGLPGPGRDRRRRRADRRRIRASSTWPSCSATGSRWSSAPGATGRRGARPGRVGYSRAAHRRQAHLISIGRPSRSSRSCPASGRSRRRRSSPGGSSTAGSAGSRSCRRWTASDRRPTPRSRRTSGCERDAGSCRSRAPDSRDLSRAAGGFGEVAAGQSAADLRPAAVCGRLHRLAGDLRMVPLAAAAWGAAWLGTSEARLALRGRDRPGGWSRGRGLRRSALALTVALVTAVVLCAAVVDMHRLRHGPVAALATQQAVVSAELEIRADPHRSPERD